MQVFGSSVPPRGSVTLGGTDKERIVMAPGIGGPKGGLKGNRREGRHLDPPKYL